MRKLIGLFLVILLCAGSVFAQDNRRPERGMDPEKRFEQMVNDLDLNAGQAEQLRALDKEYRQRMENDRNGAGELDREQMRARMEEMRTEKNARVKEILSDKQYKKYLELERPPFERGNKRGSGK